MLNLSISDAKENGLYAHAFFVRSDRPLYRQNAQSNPVPLSHFRQDRETGGGILRLSRSLPGNVIAAPALPVKDPQPGPCGRTRHRRAADQGVARLGAGLRRPVCEHWRRRRIRSSPQDFCAHCADPFTWVMECGGFIISDKRQASLFSRPLVLRGLGTSVLPPR